MVASKPVKLNLGCGHNAVDDFINCDYIYRKGVTDLVFDLCEPWPLKDDFADMVYASHVLEHLEDYMTFFRELHRVLKEGALAYIRVPYGGSSSAWADITHIRPWFPGCFCFLQPGYADAVWNSQHDGWRHFFEVKVVHGFVAPDMSKAFRIPILRRWAQDITSFFPDKLQELLVVISPLKSEAEITAFGKRREPNNVPYQLHYRDRKGEWKPHTDVRKWGFSWGFHPMIGD